MMEASVVLGSLIPLPGREGPGEGFEGQTPAKDIIVIRMMLLLIIPPLTPPFQGGEPETFPFGE
jgi:hypothetical protein